MKIGLFNKNNKIKRSVSDKTFNTVLLVIVTIYLLIVSYPIIYVIACSFSSGPALTAGSGVPVAGRCYSRRIQNGICQPTGLDRLCKHDFLYRVWYDVQHAFNRPGSISAVKKKLPGKTVLYGILPDSDVFRWRIDSTVHIGIEFRIGK